MRPDCGLCFGAAGRCCLGSRTGLGATWFCQGPAVFRGPCVPLPVMSGSLGISGPDKRALLSKEWGFRGDSLPQSRLRLCSL